MAAEREERTTALAPMGIYETLPVEALVQRVKKIDEVLKRVLQVDVHYGVIPGTKKPTLLKPGAQMLCNAFLLCPEFEIVESVSEEMQVAYTIRCRLIHIPTGLLVATGLGSCSSWEKKYRYRLQGRKCPGCDQENLRKSKGKPEWYCWEKTGGCGSVFAITDRTITEQELGRVLNEDQHDQANTILKMAEKRALVDATLTATGASAMFTQDMEDAPREAKYDRSPQHDQRRQDNQQSPPPDADAPGPYGEERQNEEPAPRRQPERQSQGQRSGGGFGSFSGPQSRGR